MKKRQKPTNQKKPRIDNIKPFTVLELDNIGGNGDPCFGKEYDLSTEECRMCGDSELCCIKFSGLLGKTRKELEKENKFKDLEVLVDKTAVKKYYRSLKRKGLSRKDILIRMQEKFELTKDETRSLYREFFNESNKTSK